MLLQVGDWVGDEWVIETGLKPGDKVIVDGLMKVYPGAQVQVGDPNAPPPGAPGAPGAPGTRSAQLVRQMKPRLMRQPRTVRAERDNTPDNLVRWISHPQEVDPGNVMPDLGVPDAVARDIAAYLYEH